MRPSAMALAERRRSLALLRLFHVLLGRLGTLHGLHLRSFHERRLLGALGLHRLLHGLPL